MSQLGDLTVGTQRPTVLFVCTGNAGRSQMAEAVLTRMAGDAACVRSAGVDPWDHLHPVAVRLMDERGMDMSKRHPKHVRTMAETRLDWVVTIGDNARDDTPELPGNPRRVHWPISDPADADHTPQQEAVFRRTLASIEQRLPELLSAVKDQATAGQLHLEAGISTCIVRPNRFDPAIHLPLIAEAGFTCIELNCNCGSDDFPWDRPTRVKELAQIAADTGVRIYSVHAVGDCLPPVDEQRRRTAMDLAKTFADLAVELGALVVPIHAGLPQGMERGAAEECLRETLTELADHVLTMPCMFAWENGAQDLTAQEHLAVLRELSPGAFGFVLDTGHAHIDGDLASYLDLAGLRLCDLHLNGNTGNRDSHVIPGQGTVSWDGFGERLAATSYTGPLMLEVEARDRQDELETVLAEAAASVDMLR